MRRSTRWAGSALAVVLAAHASAEDATTPATADPSAAGAGKIEDPARVGRVGGGAASPGATSAETRELSGRVVKADVRTLYLEHMGAVVPLKLDGKTRFSGEGVKDGGDLREGQEVRASFTVKDRITNVAERVTVASGPGRSSAGSRGGEGMPPGTSERLPPGPPTLPPENAPGLPPDRQPVPRDPGSPAPPDPRAPPVPKY